MKPVMAAIAILALLMGLFAPGTAAAQRGKGPPTRLMITFDEAAKPAIKDFLRGKGGRILRELEIVPAMSLLLDEEQVSALQGIAGVRQVGPDGRIHATDVELDNSWGVKSIGAGLVHARSKGNGIKVALIDTGVDYTHPDLRTNFAGGFDFVNGDLDPFDDNFHGTHVAGIVAAADNDLGVVGVAPAAQIFALKALDANGSGNWSDLVAALQWAVANGVQVINMSLGASEDAPGVHEAVQMAHNAGIVLVAAAGNRGNLEAAGDTIDFPARYEEVIAVGALDPIGTRAWFSGTGDLLEITAPGDGIPSAVPGGAYAFLSGTSMASPHVAGTAALVIASGITDTNGNGRTNDEVRLRLQQTAFDLGPLGKDSQFGYGVVDADKAAPPQNQPPVANAGPDQTVQTGSTVRLTGAGSFDPDGDAVNYTWVFLSKPPDSTASLSGANTATLTFTADADGIYEVQLTASDGELSSTDSVAVTAVPSSGPGAPIPPETVPPPRRDGQGRG